MQANPTIAEAVYGAPPRELAEVLRGAVQLSPLVPGASPFEEVREEALSSLILAAPPGTIERRYVEALALQKLAPGAHLTVLAPKDKGGARIRKELEAFGCEVTETSKAHHRICVTTRPAVVVGIDAAIAEGGPRLVEEIGLWSQPGIFSWDRIDPGSALLAETMPALSGRGADFGCGYGYLSRAVLASPSVTHLTVIDLDRRAIAAARRNIQDARVRFVWDDVRAVPFDASGLDFVVMNPPFHDGGAEDKALGQSFIKRAAEVLRKGGSCWLTANRHLPYEAVLASHFASASLKADRGGYKIYEAKR